LTDETGKDVAVVRANIPVTFDKSDPRAMYLDTGVFEQCNRVAVALSKSQFIPEIFQGKPADCLLLTMQAMRWNTDPLVVAQHSFVTKGKLGYEGKLIAAVVNAALIASGSEPLDYEYTKIGNDTKIVVTASIGGKAKTVEGFLSKWKTENKAWVNDPEQMLAYRGARQWARRWMPNVLLGVASTEGEDERDLVEASDGARVIDVTTALGGDSKPEPERQVRKRRTKAEIEADEKAAAEAAERQALEDAGQQRLNVDPEPSGPVIDGEVVADDPPADDPPADDPDDETPEAMLKKAVADKKASAAQGAWMQKRLDGLGELTSAKAVDLMHGQMLAQLKAHPVLSTVWEAARKIAAAKFK
jgi:hypothetical protein